ncbi:MAG: restriction endonuclease subunit R [Acidimicrobiales bacterium mtb01]|nr:DEAD/DEAH box helicase [Actinomycetota bacterium]TEX46619.1 MAG: restriction endonuclease subunit R [Acidimicrobiales bacterium mtb01]
MARNEADTRGDLIDPALVAAGWGKVEHSRVTREYVIAPGRIEGVGRPQKQLIADYVLYYRNRKLAVIEAKAESKPLTEGLGQAKEYAEKLSVRFTYATNGLGFYEVDMEEGTEGEIASFPGPDDLWRRTFEAGSTLEHELTDVPFESRNGTFGGRYYQDIAVERVLGAIAKGDKRVLLTLATGTGKTFIAFQTAWKLFQSKWNIQGDKQRRPRILFLADRNILANQAYNSFSAFDDDALVRIRPGDVSKKGSVPTNGSIFFTIFQTFMSGTDADGNPAPNFGQYPKDFFDLIIVDECHRGGANDESEWRGILEYFEPAVQVGLTATPKRTENADTYKYFGEPVYTYSLKEGINDGYLTPFRVRQISTTLDEYTFTPGDQVLAGDIEEGRTYGEPDFNKRIEIVARERRRVEIFMGLINQDEKTLVFCATQEHALLVRDLINQIKTSKDPNYCQRVTADDGDLGDQHLRNFQDNEKSIPTILTTSQKLSTGVDALNVRNIVLLRPITSMVEFKQIIGRGTRLFDGKDYFTIYDFVKAHEMFNDPEWDGPPEEPVPATPKPGNGNGNPTPGKPVGPGPERPKKIRIELGGSSREIDFMMKTTFWGPDGKQMSAEEFLKWLFGELPQFYKDEDDLRRIWGDPLTRIELLSKLGEKGFGVENLEKVQELISARDSDLYDVLAYISFNSAPRTRESRATKARRRIGVQFGERQRDFIEFVLDQYVSEGVEELAVEKLPPLLEIKYGGVAEALGVLGADASEVRQVFCGFQQLLYVDAA